MADDLLKEGLRFVLETSDKLHCGINIDRDFVPTVMRLTERQTPAGKFICPCYVDRARKTPITCPCARGIENLKEGRDCDCGLFSNY